ncbi:F-box/FBD/LRR-repeat protein [Rhynchospora pubera]|uniref:F-box/FBD/LRR-repeat protein n=1 Tax=Rhynchospora pubera TaxID=906938 RepID=A0AAV8CDY5_9POAL|nr:F-box/FBD/LRR-repeat protein [Rhynchospora pubera]
MVDRALLRRDCSIPLQSLRIKSSYDSRCYLPLKSVARWIDHAAYLGVRHLHFWLEAPTAAEICPNIFSIRSIESLRVETSGIGCYIYFATHKALIPPDIVSTSLKSLCLWLNIDSPELTRLIRGLPVLEYLELRGVEQIIIDISSPSVRTLKLQCKSSKMMKLCFPKLDFLYLECEVNNLEMFQGEMPLVTKADFRLMSSGEVHVLILESMLKSIANALELNLSIETSVHFERTYLRCCEMQLSFPRLECFKFSCSMCFLKLFQAEMPMLRKVDIHLSDAKEEFVPLVSSFLKCIANVMYMKLAIQDDRAQLKPFHILDSNKKPPLFTHLLCLELSTSCHEATIEDTISLLENCPVLNCLEMNHKDPDICYKKDKKKKKFWQSKLPRNSKGNYQHACFMDLHIKNEKSRVIELLSRRLTPKKRKIGEVATVNSN